MEGWRDEACSVLSAACDGAERRLKGQGSTEVKSSKFKGKGKAKVPVVL